MNNYAQIIVNSRTKPLQGEYTYQIPNDLKERIKIGQLVLVSLGNRQIQGIVSAFSDTSDFKTKPIIKILQAEPIVDLPKINLARFISRYYYCSLGQALFLMIPSILIKNSADRSKQIEYFSINKNYSPDIKSIQRFPKQKIVYEYLIKNSPVDWPTLKKTLKVSRTTVNSLLKKEIIISQKKRSYRYRPEIIPNNSPMPDLTGQQNKIWSDIKNQLIHTSGPKKPAMLFGRTGSGKTEIYLRATDLVLSQNKGVIILVPEIALVPQTLQRFFERFGDKISVFHSHMSDGEKYDEISKLTDGSSRIVIGSRSALFAPVQNLGLIIIDEEHEYSYKQDMTPRYHALTVAEEYCKLTNSMLIVGSATPRLETFWRAKKNIYQLFKIKKTISETINPSHLRRPIFNVVNLCQEYAAKNHSLISVLLQQSIKRSLRDSKQILLYLNRRGYSTYIFCRECGHVALCPNCSIALTYHLNQANHLICHHCGVMTHSPVSCPTCSSKAIKYYGAGTQKLEEEVKKMFPTARVLRMDFDTTRTKNAYQNIFNQFKAHRADILIGTQMITKGWDIPNVDLAGIINADAGFHLPDFRATERNFANLLQLIGRVGRYDTPGEVILQTYEPDNPLYNILAKEDYQLFAFSELIERQKLLFPPFIQLIRLTYESPDVNMCQMKSLSLFKILNEQFNAQTDAKKIVAILGPAPAFFSKINNKYRWHIILKGYDLQQYLHLVPPDWIIDVDPYSIL